MAGWRGSARVSGAVLFEVCCTVTDTSRVVLHCMMPPVLSRWADSRILDNPVAARNGSSSWFDDPRAPTHPGDDDFESRGILQLIGVQVRPSARD